MSSDGGPTGRASVLAVAALAVLAAVAVPGPVPGVGTAAAGEGPVYEADSGFRVVDGDATESFPTGMVFPDEQTVALASVTLSANDNSTVTVDNQAGAWTNLSAVDAGPAPVTVDPENRSAVTLSGGVDVLSFGAVSASAGTDIVYDASANWTLTVAVGRPAGTTVAAVTATGAQLATATVGNGTATFALPAGSGELDVLAMAAGPAVEPVGIVAPTGADPAIVEAGPSASVPVRSSKNRRNRSDCLRATRRNALWASFRPGR